MLGVLPHLPDVVPGLDGALALFARLYARNGRHDYVTGSQTAGPNVFHDCVCELATADVGPHHRRGRHRLGDRRV